MRGLTMMLAAVAACTVLVSGQAADPKLEGQLKQLFPAAGGFSLRGGDPPHIKAFAGGAGGAGQTVVGYAFYTTDLQPLERAYDGPIKFLVGMDTAGRLTGVVLVEHKEPFGDFSIETKAFQDHFRGKDIRDAFKVGADIDAIARATVSVTSASRAIRNSARRVARQLLTPPSAASSTGR